MMNSPESPQTRPRRTYIWGIDLAETLNFCGIVIGIVTDRVSYANLRKFQNIMYPNIQSLCTGELARKYPPTKIAVDSSNNQAFAEYLEGHMNPSFLSVGSTWYGKYKTVIPVQFTFQSKLDMKQNSRQLHESGLIQYPDPLLCSSEQRALLTELKDQMLREAMTPTSRGLSFPKPEGYDNDLAIANELMLKAARPYLTNFMSSMPQIVGSGLSTTPPESRPNGMELTERRMRNMGFYNADTEEISR